MNPFMVTRYLFEKQMWYYFGVTGEKKCFWCDICRNMSVKKIRIYLIKNTDNHIIKEKKKKERLLC